MSREELREEIEDDLRGDCCCDYISKAEMQSYLEHFDEWLEMANSGDTYSYGGKEYQLEIQYEVAVWQNEFQREEGEPVYMTPTCDNTDLEAIKRECEHYDIESTGCIEIFEEGCDEAILHYEDDEWQEVA